MRRRHFIQTGSALTAAAMMSFRLFNHPTPALKNIGIQLFSIPKMLETDFAKAIAMLSNMGYTEIEMYGPFPFSTEAAKKNWERVTPSLGFSGSGYFGRTADEVKAIFKEHRMRVPSVHTDYETLQTKMESLAEASAILGFEYVVLPAIPEDKRKTLDDYKRVADDFNAIGENALKHKLKFAYHNHGYGFAPMEGKVPFDMLMEWTDAKKVFLEMDIYWTAAGGADPIAYLRKHKGRYHLMHLKDMKEKKTFSGDGGNSQQWIELFPYMTTAGSGVLDVGKVVNEAKSLGVKHFFVEQDMVANPEVALRKSIDFLKGV